MCMATEKQQAKRVYDISKHISSQARKYVYGGGHSIPLNDIDPWRRARLLVVHLPRAQALRDVAWTLRWGLEQLQELG